MSEKFKFTDNRIESIRPPEKGVVMYRDLEVKGLILRVSITGNKSFALYKKFEKKPRLITIGTFPEYTVEEAREMALNLKRQMARGVLPKTISTDHVTVSSSSITFQQLFDKYINDYAVHNLTARGLQDVSTRIARNVGCLLKKPLKDITKQDILDKFHHISKTATIEANRTISYLSAIFNKGIEWELLDKNPASGIKKHKEASRDRYITLEEKEKFFKSLEEEGDQQIKDFVLISLYTGARKSNVLSMCWKDINFGNATWYIKDTKNGDPQNVVLIEEAIKILEQRRSSSSSKWVFPSDTSKSGHFQEPRKGWVRIIERAGLKDLRIHDLRRTCGSWMAISGASQYVIGKMLGHKSSQSTAIYARLSLDPVREYMEKSSKLTNGDLHKKIEEQKKKNE